MYIKAYQGSASWTRVYIKIGQQAYMRQEDENDPETFNADAESYIGAVTQYEGAGEQERPTITQAFYSRTWSGLGGNFVRTYISASATQGYSTAFAAQYAKNYGGTFNKNYSTISVSYTHLRAHET